MKRVLHPFTDLDFSPFQLRSSNLDCLIDHYFRRDIYRLPIRSAFGMLFRMIFLWTEANAATLVTIHSTELEYEQERWSA